MFSNVYCSAAEVILCLRLAGAVSEKSAVAVLKFSKECKDCELPSAVVSEKSVVAALSEVSD